MNLEILYQDDAIVVVNKPPDVLTIPDRFVLAKPNLYHLLLKQFEEIYTVHRLDKETSGLLVFARTPEAHANLNQQFVKRKTRKWYYALIQGKLSTETGTINQPLAPSTTRPGAMVVAKRGKEAETSYEVLETFKEYSFIKAEIKTGRMHQIRVHFLSIGHPLAIDALYGKRNEIFLREIKTKKYKGGDLDTERPLMNRCTLHSAVLEFQHPVTGMAMTFEAPLPKDFSALLNQLRKWSTPSEGGKLI
ncbi:MAG: RluA family pseudouridine synthase [Saprospiraceae bacterium]